MKNDNIVEKYCYKCYHNIVFFIRFPRGNFMELFKENISNTISQIILV